MDKISILNLKIAGNHGVYDFEKERLGTFEIDVDIFKPVWITDFPMFDYDDMDQLTPMHHPFTAPKIDNINDLNLDQKNILSRAYDLTINGNEVAGGSIRNYDPKIQSKIFELLKMNKVILIRKIF